MKTTEKKKKLSKALGYAMNTIQIYFRGEGFENGRNKEKQEALKKGLQLIRNGSDEEFLRFITEVEQKEYSPQNKAFKRFLKPSYQEVVIDETNLSILTLHRTLNNKGGYANKSNIAFCERVYSAYQGAVNTKEFRRRIKSIMGTTEAPSRKNHYQKSKFSPESLEKELRKYIETAFKNRPISNEVRMKAKALCRAKPVVSKEVLYLANSNNYTWNF